MSDQNAGSATNQDNSVVPEKESQDKVAYETYRRVLSEAKKLKDQVKAYEDERNKNHESKLKENNEWKALAEAKSAQAEALENNLKELNEQVINGMKYQAIEKHLGGKLRDKDYATFIEFDKIVINPETKRLDEESVKSVAAEFAKKHSQLIEFVGSGKMPNEAAVGASYIAKKPSEMTPSEQKESLRNSLNSILK